jgi:acyl-CoA thioesterase
MINYLDHPIVKGYIKANRFGRLLGMNFDVIGPGEVNYTMPVTESHLATPIAAHGGSISALMDAAMGVCALSQVIADDKVVSTIEMKISFVSPGLLGDTLFGSANIVKTGKRILFVEGKIVNQKDDIIAVATGTFNSYPSEKAGF